LDLKKKMTQIAHSPTGPNNNSTMAFKVKKKGRIVKTTVKVKDATLTANFDIVFLSVAAVMISLINIIYIIGIF
jgi:hypothetical protein